jgi:DNA-3-methyladenine glycosylase I
MKEALFLSEDGKMRCSWCNVDKLYMDYHDYEWGVPNYEDQHLFEMLCLEGAQAGLSWHTVLKKRAHYRKVFDGFDPEKMARYDDQKRKELLSDPGIIRNKLKVNAFIVNAQIYLDMKESGTSFNEYIWSFTNHQVIDNQLKSMEDYNATSPESDAMSKDLKKRGFKFIGSTICLAFMEACGMINDHFEDCWTRNQ